MSMVWPFSRRRRSRSEPERKIHVIEYDSHGNPLRRTVREEANPVRITRLDLLTSLTKMRVFFTEEIHDLERAIREIHVIHAPHLKQSLTALEKLTESTLYQARQEAEKGDYVHAVRTIRELTERMQAPYRESMARLRTLRARLYQEEARIRRLEKHILNMKAGLAEYEDPRIHALGGKILQTLESIHRILREYGSSYYEESMHAFQAYDQRLGRVRHMPLHEDWTMLKRLLDDVRLFTHMVRTLREGLEEYDTRLIHEEQRLFTLEEDLIGELLHAQEHIKRA